MTDPFAEFVRMVARMKHSDDADDALATVESLIEQARALASRIPEPGEDEVERFAAWFRKNYPGPDTIIHKPDWHAPKIFRAALSAMRPAPAEADPMSALDAFETACSAYFEMTPDELPAVREWVRVMSAAPAQGGRDE